MESANSRRLAQIDASPHGFNAIDIAGWDDDGDRIFVEKMEKLLDRLVAPKSITLKVLCPMSLQSTAALLTAPIGVMLIKVSCWTCTPVCSVLTNLNTSASNRISYKANL